MNLDKFHSDGSIYIDSNIFLYVILRNPTFMQSCKAFLTKVENGIIKAVISPLVLDEVLYKIIVENLKTKIEKHSNMKILTMLNNKPELLEHVKPELAAFMFIVSNYRGLKIVSASSSVAKKSFKHIMNYNLLPRDAMHLAIITHYKIKHIATNDSHFDILPNLNVWKP